MRVKDGVLTLLGHGEHSLAQPPPQLLNVSKKSQNNRRRGQVTGIAMEWPGSLNGGYSPVSLPLARVGSPVGADGKRMANCHPLAIKGDGTVGGDA